jgi:hypothetical protein
LNRPERKFGEVLKKKINDFGGRQKDCNEVRNLKLRNWRRRKQNHGSAEKKVKKKR